jgi:predicted nucleic acid-binding protein
VRIPDILTGTEVLFDANVLVYALTAKSADCVRLLRRCAAGDVSGFVTIDVLGDVCHRLMVSEAFGRGLIGRANAGNLQGKAAAIRQLSDYWDRIGDVRAANVAVLPCDEFRFLRAHPLRLAHGLMTNDSVLLAAAQVFGIEALATNDSDFDAVPWLDVYKPTDVP